MTKEELYEFSKSMTSLIDLTKRSLTFHYARYHNFIDNSPQGWDCVYARHTRALGQEEGEELLSFLKDYKSRIQSLEDTLTKFMENPDDRFENQDSL